MTDNITPIRNDILPELDAEREMLDYLQMKIGQFRDENGLPATRVAVVLSATLPGSRLASTANSWDMKEERSQIEICGHAAMMLTRRALDE